MRGEMSTVDGPEPEADRRYVNILVGDHKTAGTYGAAIITVQPALFKELIKYAALVREMFGLHDGDPLFPTEAGTPFSDTSAINKCLNESYVRSGTKTLYPKKFSATANRRLITTESRNVDPQSAALIAAQLCHSTAMADKTYALQRRKGLSSAAVHLADAAIRQRAEDARVMPRLAVEAMAHEEKDRVQREKKGKNLTMKRRKRQS